MEEPNLANRATPMTNGQKKILTEWVKQHPELQSGLFTNAFSKKDSQRLWQSVSLTLNAVPGASKKTWKQWRKSWADLKKNAKAKNSQINKYQRGTGGGPPLETTLTDTEKEILSMQVPTSLSGNDDVAESATIFYFAEVANDKHYNEGPIHTNHEMIDINNLPVLMDQDSPTQAEVTKIAENTTSCTPSTKATPQRKKFTTKTARYEKSLTLTKELVHITKIHNEALQKFDNKKIEILEKDFRSKIEYRAKKIAVLEQANDIQRSIAAALSELSEKLCK